MAAPANVPPPPPAMPPPPPPVRAPSLPKGWNPLVDLTSLGLFLIIVGTVFAMNPGVFSQAFSWMWALVTRGAVLRPADPLIASAVLLFALGGLSGLFTAALRFALVRNRQRAIGDALSAVGSLAFAYLLTLYAARTLSGPAVIGVLTAIVGLLILVYIVTAIALNPAWWQKFRETTGTMVRK